MNINEYKCQGSFVDQSVTFTITATDKARARGFAQAWLREYDEELGLFWTLDSVTPVL